MELRFTYIAYGWDKQTSNYPTPAKNSWVDATLIDPRQKTRDVKIISLADWSYLKVRKDEITPISKYLKNFLSEQ